MPLVEVAVPVASPEIDEPAPDYPFLEGEDDGRSVSVGDTSHGFLVRARAVQESDALAILEVQKQRDLRYGSEQLVGAIEFAAAQLHAATGRKLWLGNVGREHGGDIPWSVSHNSGRDADIAFSYLNHAREPVDPPTLVPLNGQGVSREHGLFFDAHGTWLIVKGLITYPAAQVQYLFIESGLRDQVLVAATKAGEPATLIQRAAMLMRQPVGSSPHSDHLHLRVYCSRRDVMGGCHNSGAAHPWVDLYEDDKAQAIAKVTARMDHDDVEQRARAIERLVLLRADVTDEIAERLSDDEPRVRAAAARALGELGGREDVPALVARFDRERDLSARLALVSAVGELGGEQAGAFLADAVGSPTRDPRRALPAMDLAATIHSPALLTLLPEAASLSRDALTDHDTVIARWLLEGSEASAQDATTLQLAAIAAAGRADRMEPIPRLIALLDDRDAAVRELAAHTLRMVTNVTYRVDWTNGETSDRERGLQRWRAAWERTRLAPRGAWLVMGFRAEGYDVPAIQQKHLWELVRATTGADHVSYNAQRLLTRLTDHEPPSTTWSKNDACQHWLKWLKRRRSAFALDKPPGKTVAACFAPAE